MSEMTIAQKLDLVLNEIKKNELKMSLVKRGMMLLQETTGGDTTVYQLSKNETLTKAGIIQSDLLKIIQHLVADNYIELVPTFPESHNYYIKGELFIGYEKTEILQDENFRIAQNSALQAKTYADRLLAATWCAGIAAVLLLLWQVFVYMYPQQSDWFYFWFQTIPKKS